ncbi:hypothetical protein Cflav_PD0821 [Pedosphaera parvula Ellin514]|uniref:Uncharacterized protein n=1 Tax=Pedosphaera parvula (strain Ellin514) TaxID=320771 RepID=B9XQQ7_PEDPL|nr:hypothetical protein Cflav_PD0821 [Pedosphaera parvula Ellin514]
MPLQTLRGHSMSTEVLFFKGEYYESQSQPSLLPTNFEIRVLNALGLPAARCFT